MAILAGSDLSLNIVLKNQKSNGIEISVKTDLSWFINYSSESRARLKLILHLGLSSAGSYLYSND